MARHFPPWINPATKAALLVFPLLVGALVFAACTTAGSPLVTSQGLALEQPVPFSHEHHVAGLGLDCRYCHATAATSAFAGMPSTKTCMSCHSQIWTNAPVLQPVRDSWRSGTPIQWKRVNNLPDYVYFDHGAHVTKGVGCASCHGRVDQMPVVSQFASLEMGWCLDCHRHPELALRPRDRVYDMAYQPPPDQKDVGTALLKTYEIRSAQALTDCGTCHR